MTPTTIKAMTDLLFEVIRTKSETEKINRQIEAMSKDYDFCARIEPMGGNIEATMVDALDLFFEEATGVEDIASHVLCDTGRITDDDGEYDLKNRAEFDAFVEEYRNKWK